MNNYYIFNDLNLGPENIRVQGNKKRFAYETVTIYRLNFPDVSLTTLFIGKEFKAFIDADELEEVLIKNGTKVETFQTEKPSTEVEKGKSVWEFDKGLSLSVESKQSQDVVYWTWKFEPYGRIFNMYGSHPVASAKNVVKVYEGENFPPKELLKQLEDKKPISQFLGCLIAVIILFIAAIIFTIIY